MAEQTTVVVVLRKTVADKTEGKTFKEAVQAKFAQDKNTSICATVTTRFIDEE